MFLRREDGIVLSGPSGAPSINTNSPDGGPSLSANQLQIVFDRFEAGGLGSYDLLMSTRDAIDAPWSQPINLGEKVNSPFPDNSAHLSHDGRILLFASQRPGGEGRYDLWMSERDTDEDDWSVAENLGPNINSGDSDKCPWLSPDGLILVFESDRPGGHGGLDLWVSMRTSLDSQWSDPINFGAGVNSNADDADPCLTGDGRTLVFQRNSDLWISQRAP